MSVVEILIFLFCGGSLLAIIAIGAWVLINKSKLEEPSDRTKARLAELDRRYAEGDLDEREYNAERDRIRRMGG